MSDKTIGQIAFEACGADKLTWDTQPYKNEWHDPASAVLLHCAALLRKMGEDEPTYQRQDCFERAAKAIEGLK